VATDIATFCFTGRLTRDGELSTPKETSLLSLRVAYNLYAGQGRDPSRNFIDVEVWGKYAEALADAARKGRPVTVSGSLVMDEWKDKETGGTRSKHKVRIGPGDQVKIYGNGNGNGNGSSSASSEEPVAEATVTEDEGEKIPF
jgi:single-strand DNA-binding protein